mgnify:CR=1 FL=1
MALRKVPALQAAGICTTLPLGQLNPAAHSMHAVAPAAFWYVPSTHTAQSWLFALAANVPALHSVAEVAPAKQKLPAGQAWQPDCAARPDALPNEPLAQRATVGAPSTQKPPTVHSSQAVWPASSWYLPASQAVHARHSDALLVATDPARQVLALQLVLPASSW